MRNEKGFTLLEVMIAFALLAVILFAAVMSQSYSLGSSGRSRNVLIATNLARSFLAEQELKYEGTPFERLPKSESEAFPAPYQAFKWTLTFEEVDFAVLSDLLMKQAEANKETPEANSDTLLKMFEDYLKKSVRRMSVTIEFPDGGGSSKLSFTELLVNYEADFATGI